MCLQVDATVDQLGEAASEGVELWDLPEAEILTVEIFRHVDFDPTSSEIWSLVPDVWAVWDFATWILDG